MAKIKVVGPKKRIKESRVVILPGREAKGMSAGITRAKLERAFRNDKKALKHLGLIHHFAVNQFEYAHSKSEKASARRDKVIPELRTLLGEAHFERVVKRVNKMIEGEEQSVAAR